MLRLVRIEWLKIKKYPAFWWMVGMTILTYPGINGFFYSIYDQLTQRKAQADMSSAIAKALLGTPFNFPEVWHTVAYFSSFMVLVPAILVIMLISNEYSFKTYRQNIIDGLTKEEFLVGKFIDVLIIAFTVTLVYAGTALGYGSLAKSMEAVAGAEIKSSTDDLQYIPLFFLQTISQLSIAFLLGFLLRKAFFALGVFFFYTLILENILLGLSKAPKFKSEFLDKAVAFLPLEISDRLIPAPGFASKLSSEEAIAAANAAIPFHVGYTIVFTALVWGICFYINRRRDL